MSLFDDAQKVIREQEDAKKREEERERKLESWHPYIVEVNEEAQELLVEFVQAMRKTGIRPTPCVESLTKKHFLRGSVSHLSLAGFDAWPLVYSDTYPPEKLEFAVTGNYKLVQGSQYTKKMIKGKSYFQCHFTITSALEEIVVLNDTNGRQKFQGYDPLTPQSDLASGSGYGENDAGWSASLKDALVQTIVARTQSR